MEFGLIPHDDWYQPDWIDEEKATKARDDMVNVQGAGCRLQRWEARKRRIRGQIRLRGASRPCSERPVSWPVPFLAEGMNRGGISVRSLPRAGRRQALKSDVV